MLSTKLAKWGNGQGIRIPKDMAKEIHLNIGDNVGLEVKEGQIIITPMCRRKTLAERFAEYDGPLTITETGWAGEPVGKEIKW